MAIDSTGAALPAQLPLGQGMPQSSGTAGAPKVGTSLRPQTNNHLVLCQICDAILTEIGQLQELMTGDQLVGDWFGLVVEIQALLEQLYDTPWGEAESLKRIVVAIQAQINNAPLDGRHVSFLTDVFRNLRVLHLINSAAVNEVLNAVKRHKLDLFRGTVSEPDCRFGPGSQSGNSSHA